MDKYQFHTEPELEEEEAAASPAFCSVTGNNSSPLLSPSAAENAPPNPERRTSELARFLDQASRPSMQTEMKRLCSFDDTGSAISRHHLDQDEPEAHHRTEQFPHMHQTLGGKHAPKKKTNQRSKPKTKRPTEVDLHPDEVAGGKELPKVSSEPVLMTRDAASAAAAAAAVQTAIKAAVETVTDTEEKDRQPPSEKASFISIPEIKVEVYGEDGVDNKEVVEPDGATSSQQDTVRWSLGGDESKPNIVVGDIDGQEMHPDEGEGLTLAGSSQFTPAAEALGGSGSHDDKHVPKVTFSVGDINDSEDEDARKKYLALKESRSRNSSEANLAKRRRRGTDVRIDDVQKLLTQITDTDEASHLPDSDLQDLASHRLGDTTGLHHRRHSHNRRHPKHAAQVSMVHIKKAESPQKAGEGKESGTKAGKQKASFDHHPHDMFVELDELHLGHDLEWVWQEKARWIKFEEDMEEGADRWGKPHVASLGFHSLLELRRCLEQGAVCLDLEAEDLPEIADALVEELVSSGQLEEDDKELVLQSLLLKHKHVGEPVDMKRRLTSHNLLSLDRGSGPHLPLIHEKRRHSMFPLAGHITQMPSAHPITADITDEPSVSDLPKQLPKRRYSMFSRKQSVENRPTLLEPNGAKIDGPDALLAVPKKRRRSSLFSRAVSPQFPSVPDSGEDSKTPHVGIFQKKRKGNLFPNSTTPALQGMPEETTVELTEVETDGTPLPETKTPKKDHIKIDLSNGEVETVHPVKSDVDFRMPGSPHPGLRPSATDPQILRKIPIGAEATTVLVGPVDFLDKPIMAFVRLAEGRYLGNLTEVPLPVRFIFVLLGPVSGNMDYHEVGRSISTLMANTSFHDVAYRANHRQDLLDAINEFLDDSIVLPPGEWDKETLLPIMDMARQKARERKKKIEEEKLALLPKETEEKVEFIDPMVRTKRLFGGVVNDIKRRYPKYVSDLKDGLNMQCLATFFFIYFACLSPAITFGGLLSEKTTKWMGVTEMLVSTCVNGILFALLSGQPLIVCGATGPILVFEEALYQICEGFDLDYLSFRFWVAIWITIIITLVVMFEGGVLVRYCTRFTEEIFALLISLIFIFETFKKLATIFNNHPLIEYYPPPGWGPQNGSALPAPHSVLNASDGNSSYEECCRYLAVNMSPLFQDLVDEFSSPVTSLPAAISWSNESELWMSTTSPSSGNGTDDGMPGDTETVKILNQPNTALLSLILTLGTFFLAYALKLFRSSQFLGRPVRRAIGDFGITIAIAVFVVIDLFATKHTYTEKLDVPDGFSVTAPYKRGWIVHPMGMAKPLPVWAIFFALVPAVLATILIYMETQITCVIINKSDHKLKKGSGFHIDLLLIGCFATICGTLGVPLMCAATVRSVTHLSALSIYSRTHAPGEKPKLLSVTEQRITGLAVHIMIGISVMMGPVLRHVPLAVLFGVFLYMGIATLTSIQLVERVRMLFMPVKHHSGASYVRGVRTLKMHIFTIIQVVFLAVLWAVKSTQGALAFPFILILMVPFRKFAMKYMFSPLELTSLDRSEEEETPPEEEDGDLDFYERAHMPF